MKNKKGIMLGEAFGAVLTLVLVAVLVIIAIYMFTIMATVPSSTSVTVVNESSSIGTGTYLTNYTKCGFANPVLTDIYNITGGVHVLVGNATINVTDNRIYNTTQTVTYPLTNVYISYTYDWKGDTCVASETMITQFGTFPALIGLVGTIIFLALVIGVLVASFILRRKAGA